MASMKKRWFSLLLVMLLALPGCGGGKDASTASGETSSTPAQSSSTASSSSTAATTQSTTPTTSPSTAPAVQAAVYRAHDVLKESLDAGEVKADAVWKPVYLDANCIDGWKEMLTSDESFSMKNLDKALPYVYLPDTDGVVLNANQWASGSLYWDKAGVAYTAPYAHEAILKAGTIKTISAATGIDEGALSKTEGRVAIYKNDEKIWPENDDYVTVKKGQTVDFPSLQLKLEKGDVIVIEGYGAMPGEDITADTGGCWQNHILIDPVMEVLGS